MVSNARLDLPEPDRPVTTIKLSRGISTETFLRLCTRAPCTAIVVRAAFGALLSLVMLWSRGDIEERELLHFDVALLGQPNRNRGLADQSAIRQVLTHRRHALDLEVALEVILDVPAGSGFADIA